MNAENDRELLNFGIGFTNIVERTTRANQELSRQEIEEGNIYNFIIIIITITLYWAATMWSWPDLRQLVLKW